MASDKSLDDILASIRKIVVEEPGAAAAPADAEIEIDDALLDPDFDSLPLLEPDFDSLPLLDPDSDTLPLTDLVDEPAVALPASIDIDASARALLAPMLKAWLDANLPEIVEAAVAAEIRRLTGRA